jgi:mono/diheme cytochrome c family protein
MTKQITALALALIAAASQASAEGADQWVRKYPQPDGSPARSCATCHGSDLTQPGRHARTGKRIAPLAPSVNPERLSDPNEVAKWLRRNCRWTLGRLCTQAEKDRFIAYIRSQ